MLEEKIIIFTDLDGTLLDHESYSFEEASFMLEYIKTHDIPLVIVTSKTKNEVLPLQRRLGISTPFVVENGGGICVGGDADQTMIALGKDYGEIRRAFERYTEQTAMRGFFEMSLEEIGEHTGLNQEQAACAKKRDYSEPFILYDEAYLPTLREMAHKDGLDIVKGGRFHHLITKGQGKAAAIERVLECYQVTQPCAYTTVGLGDSENDLGMLSCVDIPILIPHPDGSYLSCDIVNLIKAPYPGPKGWNSVLKEYFDVQ